jgi:hypothetical protein
MIDVLPQHRQPPPRACLGRADPHPGRIQLGVAGGAARPDRAGQRITMMRGDADGAGLERADGDPIGAECFGQSSGFVLPVGHRLADQNPHFNDVGGRPDGDGPQRGHESSVIQFRGETVQGADRGPAVPIDRPGSPPRPHPSRHPVMERHRRELRPRHQPQHGQGREDKAEDRSVAEADHQAHDHRDADHREQHRPPRQHRQPFGYCHHDQGDGFVPVGFGAMSVVGAVLF